MLLFFKSLYRIALHCIGHNGIMSIGVVYIEHLELESRKSISH